MHGVMRAEGKFGDGGGRLDCCSLASNMFDRKYNRYLLQRRQYCYNCMAVCGPGKALRRDEVGVTTRT